MSIQRFARLGSVLALGLGVLACGRPQPPAMPPPTVVVANVVQQDVPIRKEWVGQTLGVSDVAIRARVQGIVLGIHFEEGGTVRKGQLLYTVDPAEYLERVAASEADLARANTNLSRAESDLARIEPLAAMNAVSRRDLDAAMADRNGAAEQVESAQAMLNVAKINLGYTKVDAPIGGIIGISKIRVGDYVTPMGATSILNTVSDVDPIHVRFFVSESEYLQYAKRHGDPRERSRDLPSNVELILADGTVYDEPGAIVKVDRGLDPTTGALALEAAFPNPGRVLRPGQFAKVRAVVEERSSALLVPERAVQELQGRNHVFVVKGDDTVELRAVRMGPRVDHLWLVEEGLQPGERVVAEGAQKIRSGMKVQVGAAPAGE